MKRNIITLILLSLTVVFGQMTKLDSLENKMVDLALANYPAFKVNELKVKSAKKDITISKSVWADNLVGQYNLSEANIDPSARAGTNAQNSFYPRYLVGLRLTLGMFVKNPLNTQKAKFDYQIAQLEREQQKLLLKNEVKRRFRIYSAKKENFILRKQLTDEAKSQLNVATKRYNNKEITYDEYFRQSTNYLSLRESLNLAESEVYVSKYDLEELVGIDITGLE